jgi:hypothetical protein
MWLVEIYNGGKQLWEMLAPRNISVQNTGSSVPETPHLIGWSQTTTRDGKVFTVEFCNTYALKTSSIVKFVITR